MLKVNLFVMALLCLPATASAQAVNADLPGRTSVEPPPAGSAPPAPSAAARAAAEAFTRARWSVFLAEKLAGKAIPSNFCEGTSVPADMCKPPAMEAARASAGTGAGAAPDTAPPSQQVAVAAAPSLARLVAVVQSDGAAIAVYDQDSGGSVERFTAAIASGETTKLPDGRRIQSVTIGPAGMCVGYAKPHPADCLE